MANDLTVPTATHVTTHSGEPALLLTVGAPMRWPVLISPADFDLVTQITGRRAWGIRGRNVVVGDPRVPYGRRAVVKIIAGIANCRMRAVFRDRNPLNLMRENIGIQGGGGIYWLKPKPGETDPIHFDGAFPNRTPQAILTQRDLIRPLRDPSRRHHWTQRHA